MKRFLKKQLILATIVYWVLLLYIIAALVWWFIALQQHNQEMTTYKLVELNSADPGYYEKVKAVKREERSKSARNIGEGATFLLLILVGTVFCVPRGEEAVQGSTRAAEFYDGHHARIEDAACSNKAQS